MAKLCLIFSREAERLREEDRLERAATVLQVGN